MAGIWCMVVGTFYLKAHFTTKIQRSRVRLSENGHRDWVSCGRTEKTLNCQSPLLQIYPQLHHITSYSLVVSYKRSYSHHTLSEKPTPMPKGPRVGLSKNRHSNIMLCFKMLDLGSSHRAHPPACQPAKAPEGQAVLEGPNQSHKTYVRPPCPGRSVKYPERGSILICTRRARKCALI